MRIPKTSIRTAWRADWLAEFSMALIALAFLTREITFAAVGAGIILAMASLGLIFQWRLGILRRELHIAQRLSKTKVFLGDSIDGELTIRNGSQLAAHILAVQPVPEKALGFGLSSSFNQLLQPGTTSSSEFAITPLARGRFQISGFTLTLTDARGLFTGEVKYAQADWVEVYPGMRMKVPITPLRLYGGSPEVLRKAPTGMDYAGIRQYAPGDEYHRVEWKATARLRTLMVKEFHPETQRTLQILINAGRTMHQQSYVGTKLDEALAVAQLLVESAIGSEIRVGIWVYAENELVRVIKPVTAKEQLITLREFAPTLAAKDASTEASASIRVPRVFLQAALPQAGLLSMFMRLLKLRFGLVYRNTGLYKALLDAARTSAEGLTTILTDLQTDNAPLVEAVGDQAQRRIQIVVAQIGAPWRTGDTLEDAYVKYQNNDRTLQVLWRFGVVVVDVQPERLVDTVVKQISGSIVIPASSGSYSQIRYDITSK